MIRDDVWAAASRDDQPARILCIGCLSTDSASNCNPMTSPTCRSTSPVASSRRDCLTVWESHSTNQLASPPWRQPNRR